MATDADGVSVAVHILHTEGVACCGLDNHRYTGRNGAKGNLGAWMRDGEDGSCCEDLLVHLGGGLGMGISGTGGVVACGAYDHGYHGYHDWMEEEDAVMVVVVDFVLGIVL